MVINKFLGRDEEAQVELGDSDDQICEEITGGSIKQWPRNGKVSSGRLTVKYEILHNVSTINWVPTYHTSIVSISLHKFIFVVGTRRRFNYGKYIFDQILKHATSTATKMPICFPTLICGIMLNQHPGILLPNNNAKPRKSPLSLHHRLFGGTRVSDITVTSLQVLVSKTEKG